MSILQKNFRPTWKAPYYIATLLTVLFSLPLMAEDSEFWLRGKIESHRADSLTVDGTQYSLSPTLAAEKGYLGGQPISLSPASSEKKKRGMETGPTIGTS